MKFNLPVMPWMLCHEVSLLFLYLFVIFWSNADFLLETVLIQAFGGFHVLTAFPFHFLVNFHFNLVVSLLALFGKSNGSSNDRILSVQLSFCCNSKKKGHTACFWFWMAKDVGIASDGKFSAYLISRSWYNHFRSFSMGGNGNNTIYPLLST